MGGEWGLSKRRGSREGADRQRVGAAEVQSVSKIRAEGEQSGNRGYKISDIVLRNARESTMKA